MILNQKHPLKRLGWMTGYVLAYLLFTTMLFFMLTLLEKLPGSWTHLHITSITAIVAMLGLVVKRLLK